MILENKCLTFDTQAFQSTTECKLIVPQSISRYWNLTFYGFALFVASSNYFFSTQVSKPTFFFYLSVSSINNCWRALARQLPIRLYNRKKKAKSVGCKVEDMRSRFCFSISGHSEVLVNARGNTDRFRVIVQLSYKSRTR